MPQLELNGNKRSGLYIYIYIFFFFVGGGETRFVVRWIMPCTLNLNVIEMRVRGLDPERLPCLEEVASPQRIIISLLHRSLVGRGLFARSSGY